MFLIQDYELAFASAERTPATTCLPRTVYTDASISLYFCQVHHTSLLNPTVIKISLKLPEPPRPWASWGSPCSRSLYSRMRKQTLQNNQRNKSIITNCDKFHREKWQAKETGVTYKYDFWHQHFRMSRIIPGFEEWDFFFLVFLMWTIFEVFIEVVTILLLFYVLLFWLWGTWDLSSPTRDQTHTPCIGRRSLNHQGSPWIPLDVSYHVPMFLTLFSLFFLLHFSVFFSDSVSLFSSHFPRRRPGSYILWILDYSPFAAKDGKYWNHCGWWLQPWN